MKPKLTKDNTAWCPRCGDELRIMQEKLEPDEQWLYECSSCEAYFELKPAVMSKDEQNKFIWKLRDKEVFGVIRVEVDEDDYPVVENNEDILEEIDNYEFLDEETARFEAKMKELDNLGELGHTQYIGNAYYIETTTIERLKELWNILIEDAKHIPKHSTITLELNYQPEWAEEEEDAD